ncbi:protein FAM83G [Tachysurus fulvidraco]|uniref:protein FAM83G n=1 Tax=Tachysurus fulvidraco TaxID=1234273 RepID=UPI001FEF8A7B|nr:protein FAM83G [Tachysurus fulvidraco]
MALSQIQCLDDNHVNWRVSEAKPEFFYSEDQRLALEALISDGREAFETYVKEHELRPFLSEPELERLLRSVEDYRPGAEHPDTADREERALSLQYWPELSDISIPDLDLGWPECASYRGVTRVNVYTQPPVDGQTHIKEVVRKTIAQAQKLISIVMDVFTDVDIFKDLLDAGFKRKVAVYIIIEQAYVQDFLQMCDRAGMHSGHLKYLRVRCSGGSEFHTRSAKRLQGVLSQKFMFVDGDRAVSGSYSFTWTASRFDRNLITVLTGQAVETFDRQFRELYLTSRGVNLSKIRLVDLPEPDPVPVPVPAAVPSAAVARKLINPKYALVETSSRTSSDKVPSPKDSSQNPLPQPVKRRREVIEKPPNHPWLIGLPKAELIPYLPTWPDPDPPSDVIGFINIRDTSKPMQSHLMRSQLFETSQAIRFKDPFTAPPEEPLPEKACPRVRSTFNGKTKPPDTHVQPKDKPEEKLPLEPKMTPVPPDTVSPPKTVLPPTPTEPTSQDKAQTHEHPPGPPVPKPRTLQLLMTTGVGPDNVQVTVVRRSDVKPHETSRSEDVGEAPEARDPASGNQNSELETKDDDTDSNKSPELAYSTQDEGSTASDEYYECPDPEHSRLPNGGLIGSGRVAENGPVNIMARFSQSMLDLRPDKSTDLYPTDRNLLNVQSRYTGKVCHPMEIASMREAYNRAKVVIAKPGVYHRPPKSSTRVIGGHRYWQGKLATTQHDVGRSSRSPCRSIPSGGLKTSQSPTQRISHAHSPSPRRKETQMPLGIHISKLSSLQHLRGRVPGVMGDKKGAPGRKDC